MMGSSAVRIDANDWYYSPDHGQLCQVIDVQTLWGETTCRIWLPAYGTVVRISATRLKPVVSTGARLQDDIAYVATAARLAEALGFEEPEGKPGLLLAPVETSVIPLPHQIRALARVVFSDKVRYLLADEVGLGKTIEAGLIMRELKLRGLVRRTLVVAPKGLVTQWVTEMRTHFDEAFHLLIPGDFSAYRKIAGDENLWSRYDQVVCPMDSVKPLDGRHGWSREEVAEYNRPRFEDLIATGWDLIIVDEAHRLGGSTDQVARYKLGQGLSEASPYFLLISATPHQGKTDAFHRLVSLLDPVAFPDISSVTKERVRPYVVRTEKRQAIDTQGLPLFKPRHTRLVPVSWEKYREQELLYDAVTEYVREGYNQAQREKKSYIGFLMILMQRLVTSSTRAIRATLERRLEMLQGPEEQLSYYLTLSEEEWDDLDGQEQVEALMRAHLTALENERREVEFLLEAARRTEANGPDAKAEALLAWIYRLQQEETDPNLKVLIFTEFVATQEMLHEFLTERGMEVVCLNGSMDMEERKRAQVAFAGKARILVSTDAGGEGLNLQFCHVVVNYDLPWNPMRLEQRIGRVDRIGQTYPVRALNFVLQDTVEYRVRHVLEEKLTVILTDFGVDKTGDVLDSVQAGRIFDDLYVDSILDPENLHAKVESAVRQVREQAELSRESVSILGGEENLDVLEARQLIDHPLPYWVERMTVSYLDSHGGKAVKRGKVWDLTFPTGEKVSDVVFAAKDAEANPSAHRMTLEDDRVRKLAMHLPAFTDGQIVPLLHLPWLPADVRGYGLCGESRFIVLTSVASG